MSVLGGYLVSRDEGASEQSAADVVLDVPGAAQIPAVEPNAVVTGRVLPDAELEDGDGNAVSTSELIGSPLVINFWFSTCGPCKTELRGFGAVHAELGDRIRFLGVNPLDTAEVNEAFARERGVGYELLRDLSDDLTSKVGIVNYPVTLFVDSTGMIVRQTGVLEESELRRYANELLG